MVAHLILIFVMNVSDFGMTFDCFLVATIVFRNMKFIFFLFRFDFCSADLAAQLLCISRSLLDIFAALSLIVGPLARQVSRDVA